MLGIPDFAIRMSLSSKDIVLHNSRHGGLPIAGVGKSCMLLRYSDDQFSGSYISTIG